MFKLSISFFIFFNYLLNLIKCYNIIVDFESKIEYNNSRCGIVSYDHILRLPPCNSFSDVSNVLKTLEFHDIEEEKSVIFISMLNDENKVKEIILNKNQTFGEVPLFCNYVFLFIDRINKKEINNTILTIDGNNVKEFNFFHTKESTSYTRCKSRSVFIKNFKFINWNVKTIFFNEFGLEMIGFNTTFYIDNTIFINSSRIVKIDNKPFQIQYTEKIYKFQNCVFKDVNIESIESIPLFNGIWTKFNFIKCLFFNLISNSYIFSVEKGELLMENSDIYNNIITYRPLMAFINNNINIQIQNIRFYNNSLTRFIDFSSYDNDIVNNIKFKLLSSKFYNITIENPHSKYLKNNFLNFRCEDISGSGNIQDNYANDNAFITIDKTTFNDFNIEQEFDYGLLYINTNSRINITNSLIDKEFKIGVNATLPWSIILKRNEIYSDIPLYCINTTVQLYNNSIPNKLILINSTEIYHLIDSSDENDKNGDNDVLINNSSKNDSNEKDIEKASIKNKRKTTLIILITILVPIVSGAIIMSYIIYKRNIRKNQNENEFEATEFNANVDISTSVATKSKFSFLKIKKNNIKNDNATVDNS